MRERSTEDKGKIEIDGKTFEIDIPSADIMLKNLVEKDDPFIQKMIGWYCKDCPFYKKEEVEKGIRGSSVKRKKFLDALCSRCEEEELKKEFMDNYQSSLLLKKPFEKHE